MSKIELPEDYTVKYYHTPHDQYDIIELVRGLRVARRITAAGIFNDGILIAKGIAVCHRGDQFARAVGRQIALGRALHLMENPTYACPKFIRRVHNHFFM